MHDPEEMPGPSAPPLPRPEPERLPGERLLRRRRGMSYGTATSFHPGGMLVHRRAFSAIVLMRNRPAGAIWMDPDGLWRAAPVGTAVLAVSGPGPDEDTLEALETWAPSFRRFAEARAQVLADLTGGGTTSPAPPGSGGERKGGGPGRGGGERRGEVISLAAARRGGGRRR